MAYIGEGGLADIRKRLIWQKGQTTLNTAGLGTITFDPPLETEPRVVAQAVNSAGDPVFCETESKTMTGAVWTSAVIRGYRIQPLPTIGPLALLGGVISSLTGFRVAQAVGMNGVKVDWVAF